MNRRDLLSAIAAMSLAPGARALAAEGDLKGAAREAWIFALPLIEMAQARARTGMKPNSFAHVRALATPAGRSVTGPNNDTLYSSAWIDLTAGPVTLTIPPTGARYFSVSIMDMYTDNVAILGTRTIGGDGGTFTLVGPAHPGSGADIVRVDTAHAWVLARTLVSGAADLPAVHAVQDGLTLKGPDTPRPTAGAKRDAAAGDYFATAQALLASDPPRAEDVALFRRVRALGLGPRAGFDGKRFTFTQMAEIEAGVAEARALVLGLSGRQAFTNGWVYPRSNLGLYGQDYAYRAVVALGGLAALTPPEAMYMRARSPEGKLFDGDGLFRLTLPADVPVAGFWSLTMYEATPEGQFFLTENPIKRYAIGDRTPTLKRNADGSLDIWIGRADPGGDRTANWLPAPAKGPFSMTLRAYLPGAELLDGRFRFPPVVAV
jgi:hypothetical protein